jgi:hypothetical protein
VRQLRRSRGLRSLIFSHSPAASFSRKATPDQNLAGSRNVFCTARNLRAHAKSVLISPVFTGFFVTAVLLSRLPGNALTGRLLRLHTME